MGFEGLSSSVVIALAAVLWLVYLVPTWFRRREYLSTERNAVRLQQTLRIMAETSELPDQVRVENSTRGVVEQEKVLHREMQRTQAIARAQDAASARAAARQLAETRPAIAADVARSSLSSRRLRRSRLFVTVVLVAALAGAGFGLGQLAVSPVLLVGSLVIALGALVLLRQISAVARTRAQLAQGLQPAAPVATPVRDLWVEKPAAARTDWTPVPVPRPLYLSRPEAPAVPLVTFAQAAERLARPVAPGLAAAASAGAAGAAGAGAGVPAIDHAAELRAAAERSEQALREAQQQTARIVPRVEAAPPSRFASMGLIDDTELAAPDLDEALRRRRAV